MRHSEQRKHPLIGDAEKTASDYFNFQFPHFWTKSFANLLIRWEAVVTATVVIISLSEFHCMLCETAQNFLTNLIFILKLQETDLGDQEMNSGSRKRVLSSTEYR